MIVSYCEEVTAFIEGESKKEIVTRLALIAASPMANASDDEDDGKSAAELAEKIWFNAATHLEFFRQNFTFFGQDLDKWCVCVFCENYNRNRKIATDCEKPMVGCYSHKLNLEVNKMIDDVVDLNRVVKSIHKTMKAAKWRLKNPAMLRNITTLRPLLTNATRWSGKCNMVNRFVRTRPQLITVSNEESCELPIDA